MSQTLTQQLTDRALLCVECGQNFVWTAGAQKFFADKKLTHEPKRCSQCKDKQKTRIAQAATVTQPRERVEVSVICAQCEQQTTVPFYPSQGRPVYCRSCFQAKQ